MKKVANDLLGIRLIIDEERISIEEIIQLIESTGYKLQVVNFYAAPKTEDDGYRGVHFYLQESTRTFPIEIQVWDYKAALLNFYMHEVIYKSTEVGESAREYAFAIQRMMESLPKKPADVESSFVDYLFNVLYAHMKGEEEDG